MLYIEKKTKCHLDYWKQLGLQCISQVVLSTFKGHFTDKSRNTKEWNDELRILAEVLPAVYYINVSALMHALGACCASQSATPF